MFWNILIFIAVCYATMKFCCLQENSTEDGGLRSILYCGQKHSQMWEFYEIRNLSSYHCILMLISNDGHIQRILELHGFKGCDLIIARLTFWSHIIWFWSDISGWILHNNATFSSPTTSIDSNIMWFQIACYSRTLCMINYEQWA